jgi:hypothetical protein
LLAERGVDLDTLTVEQGEAAMREFFATHKPQHAELDEYSARGRTRTRTFERRMQRHDQPASALRLSFEFADDGSIRRRSLDQS